MIRRAFLLSPTGDGFVLTLAGKRCVVEPARHLSLSEARGIQQAKAS